MFLGLDDLDGREDESANVSLLKRSMSDEVGKSEVVGEKNSIKECLQGSGTERIWV